MACKDVYEDEFEKLANQFEKVTDELDEKTKQFKDMREKMNLMSLKISSYDKMIQGTGFDSVLSD
jgi:archaellum component FlaC